MLSEVLLGLEQEKRTEQSSVQTSWAGTSLLLGASSGISMLGSRQRRENRVEEGSWNSQLYFLQL